MCGIAGYSGQFNAALLSRMNIAQVHRGPDGSGTFLSDDGLVGLAHRRLAIIDPSPAGHQPMVSADKCVAIVFNGEIYNFRELREDLERNGHRFRSRSDTEVILALYKQHGADFLSKLNGMFALALFDRTQNSLLLARDRYGVKPLYYSTTPNGFVFASELRTLLEEKSVERKVDGEAVDYHLSFIWSPCPKTILRGAFKVPPGEAIEIRLGKIERSWRFHEPEQSKPDGDLSEGSAIEQLRHLLGQAVKRQLVSDVPVGSFLSGGLDSSAVVAYARGELEQLPCFTISNLETDAGFVDDLPYARSVARALDVELNVVEPSPLWVSEFATWVERLDEPLADPAALNVIQVARLARTRGIKVLLSGAGGDDLFSGYRRHLALGADKFLAWPPQEIRRTVARLAARLRGTTSISRRARRLLSHIDLSEDDRLVAHFLWLDAERVHRLTGSVGDPLEPLRTYLGEVEASVEPLDRLLFLERRFFLADHNLNYTDKASMLEGVEVRVPFLDPDLVSFATTVPGHMKLRGGEPKWIFKKAMNGLLPEGVIWRPKVGFGAPLARWLRGPLREWLGDTLASEVTRARFDRQELSTLVLAMEQGADDLAYPILSVACISAWEASLAH